MDAEIEAYALANTTPETEVLARLHRETYATIMQPVMLSGHLQGAVLRMISQMIQPKRILEVGTFTGYSAICLAAGLQKEGELHTIDNDEELFDIAARYINEAGLHSCIKQHIGDAVEIIPKIPGHFDLVLLDADKPNYITYFDLLFDRVPTGGFILADNVLYEGDVLLPEEKQSRNARAICSFNTRIKTDERLEHVLLPIRDGLMLIRKK